MLAGMRACGSSHQWDQVIMNQTQQHTYLVVFWVPSRRHTSLSSLRERTSWACGAQPGGTWPPCGVQAQLAPLLAEVTYTHTLWREHTFPSHRVCYWYDSWLAAVQSSYAIGLTALHMCHHSTSSEGLEPVDPLKAVERTHML